MNASEIFTAHPWPWAAEGLTVYDANGTRIGELSGNPGQLAIKLAAECFGALMLTQIYRDAAVDALRRAESAEAEVAQLRSINTEQAAIIRELTPDQRIEIVEELEVGDEKA